jgi:hypothetical protein
MPYQDQFPDFVLDVAIPAGFVDSSYHNDVCPSWTDAGAGLQLFIDFADRSRREFPESPRFTLSKIDENSIDVHVSDLALTDDWEDVLNAIAMQRKRVLTQTHVRKVLHKHLNRALGEIQRSIGETTGDLAGQFHDTWDNIVADAEYDSRDYLRMQCEAKGWLYDALG